MASQPKCPFVKLASTSTSDVEGIKSIANSHGAINEAMHSATDSIHFSDKDIQKGITLMEQNWNKINSKYGWMRDSNSFRKFLWKTYYFITGLLAILLLFIPLLLFIVIFIIGLYLLPLWLIQCGGKCGSVSFIDYIRLFLGNQRLNLLSYKQDEQDLLWHIRNRIIGTAQTIEFLLLLSKSLSAGYKHEQIYAKLFGGNNGKAYPYLFTLGITNYDEVRSEIVRVNAERNGNFVGFLQTNENDANSYLHAHSIGTLDFRHKFSKKIAIIVNETLPQFYNFSTTSFPEDFMADYGYFKDVDAVAEHISHIFYSTFYWLWFGIILTKEECEAVAATKSAAGYIFLPPFIHTLLANNYLLRKANQAIEVHKSLVIKYGGDKLNRIYEYCDQLEIERDIGLNCAAMTILFAGGQGSFTNIIDRYRNNRDQEKKLYETNPIKYVYETIRHHTPVPVVANVMLTEKRYRILGKEYVFPAGTLCGASMASANDDKGHFNKPQEFNPNRFSFGDTMSFNCVEGFYQKENWDKLKSAPRFCPGHDSAFLMLKTIIERMHRM